MDIIFVKIWHFILQAGSISGLLVLFYTISQNFKKRPKFKFDFKGSAGRAIEKDNLQIWQLSFDGLVKNQSSVENSVTDIYYVVWANRRRTKTLSYGGIPIIQEVKDDNLNKISLPIKFSPKEAKLLKIQYEITLTGSHDLELVQVMKPVHPGSPFYLHKYEYKLVFKDTDENLFDDLGHVRSQKLQNLWWTLPNTFHKLKLGNPLQFFVHMIKIFFCYLLYKFKQIIRLLGF